jgi:cation diffusion facilitator family transporter
MLRQFLIKRFVPETASNKRQRYGYLGGLVGIVVNILLFAAKLVVGLALNSIAIIADAFNNLTDVGSSIVTIVGFKIADKPADKDHPFGHGRGEYIAGLIVSFMVLMVGIEFVRSSFDRIRNPVGLTFDILSFSILLLSIGAKAWLGSFNNYLGKLISSGTLSASSFDSFSDVIITSTVALSLLISRFTTLAIDGYIGMVVAAFILFAGYRLVKETISPLLGEAPDPQLVKSIIKEVVSYKYIIGVHDLIVHSYGANKYIASVHAEIPADIPIMEAHEIIDKAENQISKKLGVLLVIHMDPVNVNDKEIDETRREIINVLKQIPEVLSIHDFRIIGESKSKNILFDAVVSQKVHPGNEKEIKERIKLMINEKYPDYNLIIGIDRDYTQI